MQIECGYAAAAAAIRLAEGNPHDALTAAEQTFAQSAPLGIATQDVKLAMGHALEAALALGDRAKADELLTIVEQLPPGLRPPLLAATAHRFRARLAGADPSADREFTAAAAQMRELALPCHLAVVQLEHGEWLVGQGRAGEAEPLLAEAAETFARLEATPWLERAARARGPEIVSVAQVADQP